MDITGSNLPERVATMLFQAFRAYFNGFERLVRQLLPKVDLFRVRTFENESLDGRLQTIEQARAGLDTAAAGLSELRRQTEQNRTELALALERLRAAEQATPEMAADAAILADVAKLDTETFRQRLGIPSTLDVWTERSFGFASGVAACLLIYLAIQLVRLVI